MAERSTKIMATIPDRFVPDFADRLDGRTLVAKAIRERIGSIESDMGGTEGLSHARRSLIRRTVWLEAVIEHSEQKLAAGEGIDLGGHTQAINSLLGLYRLLGLERRQRPVERLRDVMRGGAEPERKISDEQAMAAYAEMLQAGNAPADESPSAQQPA